jgi:diguanylate cyclase (GGDEF)-like protein
LGEDKPGPTPEFLTTFGEDGTDVFATATTAGSQRFERQFTLTVLAGAEMGLACDLEAGEVVLGRGEGCTLVLNDPGLSRRHCRVIKQGEQVFIEDLGSSNGTFVDGDMVQGRRPLHEGARIHLGRQTVLSLTRQDPLERHAARQLYESSMRDPLTELYNRRYFDQRLSEEHAFALRHQRPLSVILLDLDHFKQVNDTFGHPAGDEVLRQVAQLIKRCVRQEDIACRLGGEEFGVLVRVEGKEGGAKAVAERIRKRVEESPVRFGENLISITVSAGVATMGLARAYETPAALLAAADEALYRAKSEGRNRTLD